MEYFESKVRYFYDVLGCFGEVSADYLWIYNRSYRFYQNYNLKLQP